jgi:hypothetical protein
VRNNREIMEAQTFGFYQRHHSYSHFRAELSFTGDLDTEFHVDIKKAPSTRAIGCLRSCGRRRGSSSPTPATARQAAPRGGGCY